MNDDPPWPPRQKTNFISQHSFGVSGHHFLRLITFNEYSYVVLSRSALQMQMKDYRHYIFLTRIGSRHTNLFYCLALMLPKLVALAFHYLLHAHLSIGCKLI